MRKISLFVVVIFVGIFINAISVYSKEKVENSSCYLDLFFQKTQEFTPLDTINKQTINIFFKKYSNLQSYQSKVTSLYATRKFNSIWFDSDCKLIPLASLLYSKTNSLEEEAVASCFDYQDLVDGIFDTNSILPHLSDTDTEMMLSTLYVYYVEKVYDDFKSNDLQKMGWSLQKKELDYNEFLDSVLEHPKLLDKAEKYQFSQYYKLRSVLKKYREIEKKGEWNTIAYDSTIQNYKPYDSSATISQIRHRLYIMGDLEQDSKSALYDNELMKAVLRFKKRNGYQANYFISPWQIQQLNLPIEHYIQKIKINMERCRWVDPELTNTDAYIMINIPSYKLVYVKDAKKLLESNVFVGQDMMQTPIFSACVSSIVFSPYWYVPQSIINNEIKSKMARDKNYLNDHNFEWNNGNVRQKPGIKNALGLVKFVFPNKDDIYLHDTPAKMLFNLEYRAYSHGCINLQKAKDLALLILKDDPDWPEECINWAMQGEKENRCELKNEIPIYLTYFTAWVDDQEILHLSDDIYGRDAQLAKLIFKD